MFGRMFLRTFGVRVTILYKNGAKVTMRFARFDWKGTVSTGVDHVEWQVPFFRFSRQPLYVNVDEICAIWQGKV
jgi:hypothetical protein